ncbi:MAG TPA: signal peptidase I [Bryobacteraceae bacterium]|nr:signal peptidase I [Bryobacteraceae bacterium]
MRPKSKSPATAVEQKKPKVDRAESIRSFVAEWTVTVVLYIFCTSMVAQAFVVPTGSMENTVLIGDHMVVDKIAYAEPGPLSGLLLPYTPVKRGDIIVFKPPIDNAREPYVKRIIGVPGDRIRFEDKQLVLNGVKVREPYVVHKMPYPDFYRDNFPAGNDQLLKPGGRRMLDENVSNGEVVVPPGRYFAMGDNRDNSEDSRYWGFVPQANIIGKPVLVFWSYDAPTERLADPNIISMDHIVDLAQNFFTKTRWNRTFMLIRGQEPQN